MNTLKIFKKTGNSFLKTKSYSDFPLTLESFLHYQANNVFNYPDLYDILQENIEGLFADESNVEYKSDYSGVLAYGEVQSGKTANMICSLIKAYSLGFKNVFILTGNNDPLHKQTFNRFVKETFAFKKFLKEDIVEKNDFSIFNNDFSKFLGVDYSPAISFINLKGRFSINDEIQTAELNNQIEIWNRNNKMNVFFVLKNTSNYNKMKSIVQGMNPISDRNGILILDDESDWGFDNSEIINNPELYNILVDIKESCHSTGKYLKYLAFTATPYKIFKNTRENFINNKTVLLKSKVIEEWMHYNFIIENQPFYCGIDVFHKENSFEYLREAVGSDSQMNVFKTLNKNFIKTVPNDHNEDDLLKLSLILFLLNSYIYNREKANLGKSKKIVHGLFFPNIRENKHKYFFDLAISNNKIFNNLLLEHEIESALDFEKIFLMNISPDMYVIKRMIIEKLNRVNVINFVDFFRKWSTIVLNDPETFLVKMSGLETEDKKYDTKEIIDGINSVFIIGGYKIARGVTFDNLLLEVLTANSIQSDSTLQRARWFGYRDLTTLNAMDIILSEETNRSFETAIAEDDLWRKQSEKNGF
ncbi:Z1 domain-containing protein [[Acholeplasma] multilocale]|uniref:Z1 domain-containing protein n=1 Tax=[Acholeplasma] multilocale TaxID=264638 RepID=UPI00047BD343|nr:Z1 domain-containing protein [[Acholeplasma] multilocale]